MVTIAVMSALLLGVRATGGADDQGCSGGYTWCATENKCLRLWEEVDLLDVDLDGQVSVEEFTAHCTVRAAADGLSASTSALTTAPISVCDGAVANPTDCYATGANANIAWCEYWADLTEGEQCLWETLGATPASWDSSDDWVAPIAIVTTCWSDLTSKQQSAATALCFFPEAWDAAKYNSGKTIKNCPAPSLVGVPDTHGCTGGYQWCATESKCLRSWVERGLLDADQDGRVTAEEFDSHCTADGLAATSAPISVCDGAVATPEDCTATDAYSYDAWCEYWADLTEGEQCLWETLGVTPALWDSSDDWAAPNAIVTTCWSDLTSKQQSAAKALCFNPDMWDAAENNNSSKPIKNCPGVEIEVAGKVQDANGASAAKLDTGYIMIAAVVAVAVAVFFAGAVLYCHSRKSKLGEMQEKQGYENANVILEDVHVG